MSGNGFKFRALSIAASLIITAGCDRKRVEEAAIEGHSCEQLSRVKMESFKLTRPLEDVAYDELLELGEMVRPCVIRQIANADKAIEQGMAPPYNDLRVGDLALFYLATVDELDWPKLLPPEVQADFKLRKMDAYFSFVKISKHREQLRDQVSAWYAQGYKPNPDRREWLLGIRESNREELKKVGKD